MEHELPARSDLEWYRKQAKDLVRRFRAGDREAVARVEETAGERTHTRFRLSDAQWLIAREHGFRSWAEFANRVREQGPEPAVERIHVIGDLGPAFEAARASWGERGEATFDSGLSYGPAGPVLVRATKRQGRYGISDLGGAVAAAGRPPGWREARERIAEEHVVNISRSGVVSLPAVERSGLSWLSSLPARIAAASFAFYEEMLELDDSGER